MPDLMGNGDPQVEARVLGEEAAPGGGAGAPQLGDPPNLPVTIRQLQVKPRGVGGTEETPEVPAGLPPGQGWEAGEPRGGSQGQPGYLVM